MPDISDHDVVLFDVNMKPKHQAKLPHKVYNYKKVNLDQLKSETQQFSNQFVASDPLQNSVDTTQIGKLSEITYKTCWILIFLQN